MQSRDDVVLDAAVALLARVRVKAIERTDAPRDEIVVSRSALRRLQDAVEAVAPGLLSAARPAAVKTTRARRRRPERDRLMEKVRVDENGCWRWQGSIDRHGYGQLGVDSKVAKAHRVAYETFVGPIPVGLQMDHLCRVRDCVNPKHLEPVTAMENQHRRPDVLQDRCKQGHPFTEDNTYTRSTGHRGCRTCNRESARRTKAKQRERLRQGNST